jgi:hypothetical protein
MCPLSNLSLPILYLSFSEDWWRIVDLKKQLACIHLRLFTLWINLRVFYVICVFWIYWEELVQMTTRITCLRSRSWLCEASRVALLPWLWCIILQYLWIFYVFGSGINHVTVTKILCSHIILRVGVPGSWICVFLMFIYSFSEFYIVCLILCIIIVTKWTVTLWPIVCVIVSQVRIHESELKCWFKRNFVGLIFIRFFSIALCLYA